MTQYAFNWFALPPMVTALVAVVAGWFMLRKDWTSSIALSFLPLMLVVAVWFAAQSAMFMAADAGTALIWARLLHTSVAFLPTTAYLYGAVALGSYRQRRPVLWVLAAISMAFVVLVFRGGLLIHDVEENWWGHYVSYGPAGPFFIGFVVFVVGMGALRLWARLHSSPYGSLAGSHSLVWLLSVGVLSLACVDFLSPMGLGVYPFGYAPMIAFVVLMAFSQRRFGAASIPNAVAIGETLASLQGAVLIVSPDGTVGMANHAAARLFGREGLSMKGVSLAEIAGADRRWQDIFREGLRSAAPQAPREMTWQDAKGEFHDLSVAAAPAKSAEGHLLGVALAIEDVSERRRIEDSLWFAQYTLDHAGELAYTASAEGRLLYANETLVDRLGFARSELLTMSVEDIVHGVGADSWRGWWDELAKGGTLTAEVDYRTKGGEVFPGEFTAHLVDYRGERSACVFARDITARKQNEAVVLGNLRRMSALNSVAVQMGVDVSIPKIAEAAVTGATAASGADLALLFLKRGNDLELIESGPPASTIRHESGPLHRIGECLCGLAASAGKPIYSMNIHDDRRCTWDECKRAGVTSLAALPLLSETRVVGVLALASAGEKDFEEQAPFLTALAGEVGIGIKNALLLEDLERHAADLEQEVAERTQLARELGEQRDRFAAVAETAPGAVCEFRVGPDGSSSFTFVSQVIEDVLGVSQDVLAKDAYPLRERIHPDDVDRVADSLRRSASDLSPWWEEYRYDHPTKGEVWLEGHSVPSREENGDICWQGFITDISQRKRNEQALLDKEEELRQSQKMEAVGQLAGGIAHDFNNLLTAIAGYTDLLLEHEQVPGSPLEDDLLEIRHAADRAAALTRQILAFSRRQALRPEVISLNDVVVGMEPLLRRTLGEHIDFETLLHPRLGLVEVDRHQLEQVLMNLALNARDAMPAGGRLVLETANMDLDEEYCRRCGHGASPGSYVMLSVTDTGMGMDSATLEHAFEPFFTTKAPGEGTGLGLSMVYGVVHQSNGSLSVWSEPGQGASFKIFLPRTLETPREIEQPVAHPAATPGNEAILVVEDEQALRALIQRVLRREGYHTLAFGSADEAWEAIAERRLCFDLLLTDVLLPGAMQGHDLARVVQEAWPDLPVLFISGYTRDALVSAGRLESGVNLLEKPFTAEALAEAVRGILDRHPNG